MTAAAAREAAVRLVKARAEALAAGDAQGLLAVSAADSPARRQDERLAAALRPGEAFEGLSSRVTAVGEARTSGDGSANGREDGRTAEEMTGVGPWELVIRTENTAYRFRGAVRPARTEEARVTVTRASSEWLLVGYAPQGAAVRGPFVSSRARSSPGSPGG